MRKKLDTIVLAGYNEESNIERSMELSYKALEKAFYNYELILIDDASKDCTLEKMYKFAEEHINVRVLPNYINLNFGTSVLRGLLMANYDYIVYNACDLPLAPDDMIRVLVEEENADVILFGIELKST